jgi:hypothetical protein
VRRSGDCAVAVGDTLRLEVLATGHPSPTYQVGAWLLRVFRMHAGDSVAFVALRIPVCCVCVFGCREGTKLMSLMGWPCRAVVY